MTMLNIYRVLVLNIKTDRYLSRIDNIFNAVASYYYMYILLITLKYMEALSVYLKKKYRFWYCNREETAWLPLCPIY